MWRAKKSGWWRKLHPPAWLQQPARQNLLQPLPPARTEPTTYVDVSHADADAPKQAKYYSNKNSRAANRTKHRQRAEDQRHPEQTCPKPRTCRKRPANPKNRPPSRSRRQWPSSSRPCRRRSWRRPTGRGRKRPAISIRSGRNQPGAPAPTPAPPARPRTLEAGAGAARPIARPGDAASRRRGPARVVVLARCQGHAVWRLRPRNHRGRLSSAGMTCSTAGGLRRTAPARSSCDSK